MIISILLVLGGTVLLLGGGELLVRGAASLARSLGVSAMVVGLTVVAFGTSAPELVVSVQAVWKGNPSICGGNIVGSNILNILLVLGATAVLCPLRVTSAFVRREVPLMIGVSLLLWYLVHDASLSGGEAGVLLGVLAIYTVVTVLLARREKTALVQEYADEQPAGSRSVVINLVMIVGGVAVLGGGSTMFLRGAIAIAQAVGMSEALIGLTLVAMGTSLPEMASSVMAAWRKHPDICLGNVIGSCIYNILWIGGTCGLIRAVPFDNQQDRMLSLHVPVMVLAAVVLWPIVATGHRISRWEGAFLLILYAAYLGWTINLGL